MFLPLSKKIHHPFEARETDREDKKSGGVVMTNTTIVTGGE
jgi:hypothetical protein